jgi:hypothetical protein
MEPIPPSVSREVELLRGKIKDHIQLAFLCIQAADGNTYNPDLWVNAAVRRSIQVLDGFATMVLARNLTCCGAMLRTQLDTAMRLFASTIVSDADAFVSHMMGGGKLDHFRDRAGVKLTDRHLCQELSKFDPEYGWVPRVYAATCEFVHMSGRHVTYMAEVTGERTISYDIQLHDDRWPERSMLESIRVFGATTDVILSFVHSWLLQKSSYTTSHEGPDLPL